MLVDYGYAPFFTIQFKGWIFYVVNLVTPQAFST